MAQPTNAELLAAGLRANGWRETDKSGKYRTFTLKNERKKMFVGPNGALRFGATRSATHSLGDPSNTRGAYYTKIMDAGSRALNIDSKGILARLAEAKSLANANAPAPTVTTEIAPDAATAEFTEVMESHCGTGLDSAAIAVGHEKSEET